MGEEQGDLPDAQGVALGQLAVLVMALLELGKPVFMILQLVDQGDIQVAEQLNALNERLERSHQPTTRTRSSPKRPSTGTII